MCYFSWKLALHREQESNNDIIIIFVSIKNPLRCEVEDFIIELGKSMFIYLFAPLIMA